MLCKRRRAIREWWTLFSSRWSIRWHGFKCYFRRHDYRLHKYVKVCKHCSARRKRWRDDKGGYMPLTTQGNWIVRAYGRDKDDDIDFKMKNIYQGTSRWFMFWAVIYQMTRAGAPKIIIEWEPW